jgi:hypothetical protein
VIVLFVSQLDGERLSAPMTEQAAEPESMRNRIGTQGVVGVECLATLRAGHRREPDPLQRADSWRMHGFQSTTPGRLTP